MSWIYSQLYNLFIPKNQEVPSKVSSIYTQKNPDSLNSLLEPGKITDKYKQLYAEEDLGKINNPDYIVIKYEIHYNLIAARLLPEGMSMKIRSYVISALAIMAVGILLPAASFADGRYHGHRGGEHWSGGHGGGHHWGGHYYGGDSFSLGLGFVFPFYSYGYPYDYSYGYPVYGPPPVAQLPPSAPLPDQSSYTVSQEEPAYCREYTKKILVDGKEEVAYGTACLRDDGS